ncbi:hypothetical protein RUND412_008566 [Rhizina undulata]
MFTCRLCLRRCLTSLLSVHSKPRQQLLPRRTYASVAISRITSSSPSALKALASRRPRDKFTREKEEKQQEDAQKKNRRWRRGNDEEGRMPDYMKNITDPVKLALMVQRRLEKNDTRIALETLRNTRGINTVVGWNHLIDWRMKRGDVAGGFKSFNEMKKRGTHPDAYTFSIIFRNLADYSDFELSRGRALSTYNSMLTPNAPVRPNIIHTNAVLKVCALTKDLDSLWSIVSSLPMSGPNSPNAITYTTLLNGIQGMGEVEDGRRAWSGILSRWSKGNLWIDEALASAMCKVLLQSEHSDDWKEVFVVVEQVFGIKRFDAPEQKDQLSDPKDMIFEQGTFKSLSERRRHNPSSEKELGTFSPPVRKRPYQDSRHSERSSHSNSESNRPTPGPSILQCLLEACTKLKDRSLAVAYWNTLSLPPHNVHPDLENHHEFLRLLRISRSGKVALDFIENMGSAPYRARITPTAKTFYIAMSSCKRSGRTGSFPAAERMLTIMREKYNLRIDAKIWDMFLQVAMKTDDPNVMKKALRIVDENWNAVAEMSFLKKNQSKFMENALVLVKRLWGVTDMLLGGATGWGHGEREALMERKKKYGRLVTGHMVDGLEKKREERKRGRFHDDEEEKVE